MSDEKKIMIGGFEFSNEAEAAQARKEEEGVKYIREKTDMDNPEMVLQIYNKMIQQNLFETAVGFSYLKDLQEYLMAIPYIAKEDVLPIPVRHPVLESNIRKNVRTPAKKAKSSSDTPKTVVKEKNADYKVRYEISLFIAVILAASVIAMFFISASSGSPNILNYENKLINKYEAWEQELNEREAAVKQQEQDLGIEYIPETEMPVTESTK